MNNLYFKKTMDDSSASNLVYMKTMCYMTSIDEKGKEIVEMYDEDKFISVNEYFNKATLINKFASRVKPVKIGKIDDISFINEDKYSYNYILIYANKDLGIGYDLETESYEVIPTIYICDYNCGGWKLGAEVSTLQTDKKFVIRNILGQMISNQNSYTLKK